MSDIDVLKALSLAKPAEAACLRPSAQGVGVGGPPCEAMALKKFEHFLAAHRRPEWRYIAYDVLKQLLRSHPSAFLDTLWREIAEVDAFFQRLNYGMEAESKHLATFALLNHLAVKRILQKHAKHSSCKRDSPNAEEFCGKLCESVLFMSKAATLESDDQASEVAKILRDVALDCRVSDKEEGHEANAFAIGETDLRHVNASYVQISGVPESEPQHVNIMTWNTCAISFPLHIPSAKFLMGLFFLGCWWHDSRHDAPMQIHSVLAQQRFAKQADYIRHSGADLILLQEMLSTSMLDSLMLHLADEFDFAYMRCSPRFGAFILWTLFLLLVAFGQCLCIQLLIVLPCSQFSHSLPASWCWLLICPLFTSLVLRWRHSVPAHFLFGDVAGQLVVLRRKSCLALTGDGFFAESFETFGSFEATSDVASIETPSWLSVFFNVRLRGVLRVSVPLTLSKCRGKLTLLNTHLPHQTDNAKLLQSLGSYAAKFTSKSAVVLAGDFNPLPDLGLSRQLEPLVQSGLVATDGLLEQNCTWDLQQSLTRRNSNTPRSMQLDFIFLQNQRDGDFPEPDKGLSTRLLDEIDSDIEANCSRTLEMKVLSTAVVDPEKFLTAPLSDHYGLLSQVELAWHM